jgi:hypothetical protein
MGDSMAELVPCVHCGEHIFVAACVCAHCGVTLRECSKPGNKTAAAVLLGFTLSGCAGGGEGGGNAQVDYGSGYYYSYGYDTGDTGDTDDTDDTDGTDDTDDTDDTDGTDT